MRIFVVILILMISAPSMAEEVTVRFGRLEISERVSPTSYRFGFLEETSIVPLLTLKQGGIYGVEYRAPEGYEYKVQVKAIIPPEVVETGGDIVSTKREADRTVMVFKPRTINGTSVEPFLFTQGDPAGEYTLEVTVNGTIHKTITYQAYVPVAH